MLDEVGKSQRRDEPQCLPRANQVCSASETRRDKLAANYLAFIQCPLHLCRFTAPECSLRTKCGDSYHSVSMTQGRPLVRFGACGRRPCSGDNKRAVCESLRPLVEHPKRTLRPRVGQHPPYVQSVLEHRGHRAPHGKPLVMPPDDSAESTGGRFERPPG